MDDKDKKNAYYKDLYYLRKKYHKCVRCGREALGRYVRCARCMAKMVEYETQEDRNRRGRNQYKERRAAGLCVTCGAKTVGGACRCLACAEKERLRLKLYRLKQNANTRLMSGAGSV